MSISQRMAQLRKAEEQWIENYRKSLEEWNERNKVRRGPLRPFTRCGPLRPITRCSPLCSFASPPPLPAGSSHLLCLSSLRRTVRGRGLRLDVDTDARPVPARGPQAEGSSRIACLFPVHRPPVLAARRLLRPPSRRLLRPPSKYSLLFTTRSEKHGKAARETWFLNAQVELRALVKNNVQHIDGGKYITHTHTHKFPRSPTLPLPSSSKKTAPGLN